MLDALEQFNIYSLLTCNYLFAFLILSIIYVGIIDIQLEKVILSNLLILLSVFALSNLYFISGWIFLIIIFFGALSNSFWLNSKSVIIFIVIKMLLDKINELMPYRFAIYNLFLIAVCFLLILLNVLGLIPFTFAITSHFMFAFYFSLVFFIVNIFIGFVGYGVLFFNFFLPDNVPLFIIPMLIIIELISFISRALSLAIRLFANIVAGHILLKILISFLFSILLVHLSFLYPLIAAFLGIFIITILETFIAFLQAYIFVLLLIIYISSVIKLH